MTQNVGQGDRFARGLVAIPLIACSVFAPFSLEVRLALFAAPALYFCATALAGTCLGYRLLGKSTCPAASPGAGGPRGYAGGGSVRE
jgi:hypothetical protein